MRLFNLLPLIPLVSFTLATPTPTSQEITPRAFGLPGPCILLPTRDEDTCQCKPGFIKPPNAISAISSVLNCVCPDVKNTDLYINSSTTTTVGRGGIKITVVNIPYCVCRNAHQSFDATLQKCVCLPRYTGTYLPSGGLKCTPTPTPSPGTGTHRRLLNAAIKEREASFFNPAPISSLPLEDRSKIVTSTDEGTVTVETVIKKIEADGEEIVVDKPLVAPAKRTIGLEGQGELESVMGCKGGEKACLISGKWGCTDILSSLSSCGGCPGEAIDCEALPGVDEVSCYKGQCQVDSCQRGYTQNATSCIPSAKTPWLQFQIPSTP